MVFVKPSKGKKNNLASVIGSTGSEKADWFAQTTQMTIEMWILKGTLLKMFSLASLSDR